jgi:hypothetical protein
MMHRIKSVALMMGVLLFTSVVQAQTDTSHSSVQPLNKTNNSVNSAVKTDSSSLKGKVAGITKKKRKTHKPQNGVIIKKNGVVVITKNGTSKTMYQDTRLLNGSVVMTNGTVILKDGTHIKLKEGDYIDSLGNITFSKIKTEVKK